MPKTPDEFAAALFVLIVLGALVTVALGRLVVWIASAVERARSVKGSTVRVRDYVTSERWRDDYSDAVSRGGKSETVKSAETETPRNAPTPAPAFDVNALRLELRAAALGSLLAQGLIVPGKRTEAMRAVFGKVTGDAYTRAAGAVKRHEQQVLAMLPPVEEVEPEAPRLVPVNGGKAGYIEL
jgi:hypothetical protein